MDAIQMGSNQLQILVQSHLLTLKFKNNKAHIGIMHWHANSNIALHFLFEFKSPFAAEVFLDLILILTFAVFQVLALAMPGTSWLQDKMLICKSNSHRYYNYTLQICQVSLVLIFSNKLLSNWWLRHWDSLRCNKQ